MKYQRADEVAVGATARCNVAPHQHSKTELRWVTIEESQLVADGQGVLFTVSWRVDHRMPARRLTFAVTSECLVAVR